MIGSLSDGSVWGALAYRASGAGTRYGGYFTSTITGTGKDASQPLVNIGISSWGDLMGADIHGTVYGLYAEGENYGIYANGNVFRTGLDIHLQENGSGENSVMYTQVSTEMTVQTYGIGQLQNGKSTIAFDQAFAEVLSSTDPIVVTITPIGKSQGVYLDHVDGSGFVVRENNNGKSNVQFNWIAIAKRTGFENTTLPADVIAADYNEKIHRGLHNDNNITTNGEGLYYKNGMLHNGHLPEPRISNIGADNNVALEPEVRMQPLDPENVESIEKDKKLK